MHISQSILNNMIIERLICIWQVMANNKIMTTVTRSDKNDRMRSQRPAGFTLSLLFMFWWPPCPRTCCYLTDVLRWTCGHAPDNMLRFLLSAICRYGKKQILWNNLRICNHILKCLPRINQKKTHKEMTSWKPKLHGTITSKMGWTSRWT